MTVNTSIIQLLVASLVFLSTSLVSTEYVPVFIWESSKSSEIVPALPRISQETFKEIVQDKLDKKSFVVVFAEPNLSSEDFGAVDGSGNKVFSHLSNIKAASTYLPSVNDPLNVLKSTHNNEITQTTIKDFNIDNIKSSILIVDLDDVQDDEDRNGILKRHDESIYNIYKALQEKEADVFAVYTGYHTSWITPELLSTLHKTRNVLQASTRADENRKVWSQAGFLLFVSDVPYITIRNTRTNLTDHTATVTTPNNATMIVRLEAAGAPGVALTFIFSGGYWKLNNSTLLNIDTANNEIPLRITNVNAPEGFSLQCTNTAFAANDTTSTLILPGMQLQASRTNLTRFGDPLYCVGFTTAPIWSGIFVTAILVSIMAIGLSMMMDIKTMDRFDDPKGKTIQINVSE